MYFKDKKRIIFAVILMVVIAIGVGFSIYHESNRMSENQNQNQNENQQENNNQESDYLKQIDLVLFNNDKSIKWNLDSEKLVREDEGNIYNMNAPKFKAFENEQLIYTGQGTQAMYNNDLEEISLDGDININKEDLLLETETIIWNQKDDTVSGKKGVKLTSPDLVITAHEFSGPLSLNKITFYGTQAGQAKVEWR